jgi:peptide deformylase
MAILPIRLWPDLVLSTPCSPAVLDDVTRALAADMLETMYAAPGRGLAAPQVGQLVRLFVMDTTWKEGTPSPRVMVNPKILWQSPQRVTGPEGCLSIPGVLTQIDRAAEIRLRWLDLDGTVREETLTGFAAVCAQHEYDHLDGVVTFDRLDATTRALAEAGYAR